MQFLVLCAFPSYVHQESQNVTAPMAIAAGAAGVGVGSAVNKLNNEVAMIAAVRSLREALQTVTRSTVVV